MNEILQRIYNLANRQNRNCLGLVVGPTGTGKSLACVKLALTLQKDWTLDNLVFKAKDFLKLINSGKLKRGDVIIWDECGVEFDSRQFFSVVNRMISYVLESFRHKNLIVLFNVPNSSMVDLNLRRLFHYQFEAVGINYKEGFAVFKVFEVEVANRTNKVYFKYPRTREAGRIVTINRMEISLPPKEVIDAYEVRKEEFTTWLNTRAEKEVSKVEEVASSQDRDISAIIEKVKREFTTYEKQRGGRIYLDANLIAIKNKIGLQTAKQIKAIVEQMVLKNV